MASIDTLPNEILQHIISFLNMNDVIGKCLSVNKVWKQASRADLKRRRHLTISSWRLNWEKWPGTLYESIRTTGSGKINTNIYAMSTEDYFSPSRKMPPPIKDIVLDVMPNIRYLRIDIETDELKSIVEKLAPNLIELDIKNSLPPCSPGVTYPSLLKLEIDTPNFTREYVTDDLIYACPRIQSLLCWHIKVTYLPLSINELQCHVKKKCATQTLEAILHLSNLTKLNIVCSLHMEFSQQKFQLLRLFRAFDKLKYGRFCIYRLEDVCTDGEVDNAVGELINRNPKLEHLELHGLPLTDRSICHIKQLSNLKVIDILSNKITSSAVLSFFRGPYAKKLKEVTIEYSKAKITESEFQDIDSAILSLKPIDSHICMYTYIGYIRIKNNGRHMGLGWCKCQKM